MIGIGCRTLQQHAVNASCKRCSRLMLSKDAFSSSAVNSTESVPNVIQSASTQYGNFSASSKPKVPIITSRKIQYPNHYRPPKQAWLETLSCLEDEKYGMIDLHPDVFATHPRLDVLHKNVVWQRLYRYINYASTMTRAEIPGTKHKYYRKGSGGARHSDSKAPNFIKGAKAHGPRGPESYFYMLPRSQRALGLRVALSCKFAQNDLHIVDSLELPTDDPQYLEDLMDTRYWGFSCLFVDDSDFVPENIALATGSIPQFNVIPVYGLNVYSMLKHETVVLTLAAAEKIEEKLLFEMHKTIPDFKYSYATRYRKF